MPIIHNTECPCKDCGYYDGTADNFCKKKQRRIYQHNGNEFHYKGQWILPCGGYSYVRSEVE